LLLSFIPFEIFPSNCNFYISRRHYPYSVYAYYESPTNTIGKLLLYDARKINDEQFK